MFIPEIFDIVPDDESKQYSSWMLLQSICGKLPKRRITVLDLGCGDGKSVDRFRTYIPQLDWKGLDIESSPEVDSRTRRDCEFFSYNGTEIPFEDGIFDIVFSNQVFEHARYPERLIPEVSRVLKRGGLFFGSVSYLEPCHSFSYFNFTPYGW